MIYHVSVTCAACAYFPPLASLCNPSARNAACSLRTERKILIFLLLLLLLHNDIFFLHHLCRVGVLAPLGIALQLPPRKARRAVYNSHTERAILLLIILLPILYTDTFFISHLCRVSVCPPLSFALQPEGT